MGTWEASGGHSRHGPRAKASTLGAGPIPQLTRTFRLPPVCPHVPVRQGAHLSCTPRSPEPTGDPGRPRGGLSPLGDGGWSCRCWAPRPRGSRPPGRAGHPQASLGPPGAAPGAAVLPTSQRANIFIHSLKLNFPIFHYQIPSWCHLPHAGVPRSFTAPEINIRCL